MLQRNSDFQIVRESLLDAYSRLENPDYSPAQKQVIREEISNYLRRYHEIAREQRRAS